MRRTVTYSRVVARSLCLIFKNRLHLDRYSFQLHAGAQQLRMACTLRVIFINDVYVLDNLSRFKSCIDKYKTANTISLIAGDFLAPSLLSTLDYGFSMVDTLNACGLNYACFGNHECDVPYDEMIKRIKESKFTWINTNMQSLDMQGLPALPEYVIVEAAGAGFSKRIGLLGLCSADPGLYKPGAYNGAKIEPVLPTFLKFQERLLSTEHVDLVLPMTHQAISDDRKMAGQIQGIPVICGGHEHEAYDEVMGTARILKMGADAVTMGVIDFTWETADQESPTVTVLKVAASDLPADPRVEAVVESHNQLLEDLKKAALTPIPRGMHLSSRGIRLHQTTMGDLLVSAMRDGLLAEGAMFNAGGIRANKDYPPDQRFFTFADFEAEMPFNNEVCVVRMPGRVLSDTIAYSRAKSFQTPPIEYGGFFQVDDGMVFDDARQQVTHVNHKPIDMDKEYDIVAVLIHLEGIDNVVPLVEWAKANPDRVPRDGISCKHAVMMYYAKNIWYLLGKFTDIDTNQDGRITREEFAVAAGKRFRTDIVPLVVDSVFGWVDADGDGVISKAEMLAAVLNTAFSLYDRNKDGVLQANEIQQFAEDVLGHAVDMTAVQEILDVFDHNNDGEISLEEVRQYVMRHNKPRTPSA